jgi:hypothetical protein
LGKNGFGVYLGPFDHVFFVSYTHDFTFRAGGSDLEASRESFWLDNQGMITASQEGIFYALIYALTVMVD